MGYTVAPGVGVSSRRGMIRGEDVDPSIAARDIVGRNSVADPEALKVAEENLASMHAKGLLLKDGAAFKPDPPKRAAKSSKPKDE